MSIQRYEYILLHNDHNDHNAIGDDDDDIRMIGKIIILVTNYLQLKNLSHMFWLSFSS